MMGPHVTRRQPRAIEHASLCVGPSHRSVCSSAPPRRPSFLFLRPSGLGLKACYALVHAPSVASVAPSLARPKCPHHSSFQWSVSLCSEVASPASRSSSGLTFLVARGHLTFPTCSCPRPRRVPQSIDTAPNISVPLLHFQSHARSIHFLAATSSVFSFRLKREHEQR